MSACWSENVARQHALPGPHLLVHLAPDDHHRMQPQVLAERRASAPPSGQQRRRVERTRRALTTARGARRYLVAGGGARLDAAGGRRPRRARARPRVSTSMRVPASWASCEPGLERRLLRAELAAVVTEAADLRAAAAHVALHHLRVPAERVEAAPRAPRRGALGTLCSSLTEMRSQTASRLSSNVLAVDAGHAHRRPTRAARARACGRRTCS